MAASLQISTTFPPAHANRTIVLCFDGTQNQIGDNLSNVAKFYSLLERGDPSRQLVYYQTGIGTYTSSSLAKGPISSRVAKTLDSMFATSIEVHVQEGYRYLMDNYLAGDRICIFGFSRGAYTARALAAMLHKVGLLQRGNHRHIPYAWKAYTLTSEEGWKRAGVFKRCFGTEVDIEFIGVWDSVGSLGLNRYLPLTTSNTRIKAVRHALALDERRARFKANVWGMSSESPNVQAQPHEVTTEMVPPANAKGRRRKHSPTNQDDERRLLEFERMYIPNSGQQLQTDVLEVWFAGCHSDVGGGNTPTDARHALSRISLRWMVRQCFSVETGIMFKEDSLRKLGIEPYALYPAIFPRPPPVTNALQANKDNTLSEEEEDLLDLRCPINDELRRNPAWWILEVVPARKKFYSVDGGWRKKIEMNLGKPREIHSEDHGLLIHRTVKQKMEVSEYRPSAQLKADPRWVD